MDDVPTTGISPRLLAVLLAGSLVFWASLLRLILGALA